jgi:HAD superfamily hydrolase (TIGR01662 family)
MVISAVYFDIGETVLDRNREYAALASRYGVSPHTFSAVFGAMIERGGRVTDLPAQFGCPDQPWTGEALDTLVEADLYPDARPSLQRLRDGGMRVGIAGNQTATMSEKLRRLDLPVDDLVTSAELGVAKPDARFFLRLAESAQVDPHEIVYVGDQIGNDVLAAVDAGLQSVRILRGPWGLLVRDQAAESRCVAVVRSLTEVADLLTAS